MVECPKCGDATRSTVGGLMCVSCGWHADTSREAPLCPTCGKVLRHRFDGLPGYICDMCGPLTDPEPITERPPYRSARHALEMYIQIRKLAMVAPSRMGADLSRLEEGQVQASRKGQLSACHTHLGNLVPAFDALDEETRLILEMSVEVPDWSNVSRRCPECAHIYSPIGYRCSYCNVTFGVDDPCCPKCGRFHTAFPVWPKQRNEDGVELPNGKDACPKCNVRTDGEKVADKARTMARELSALRSRLFAEAHNRPVFVAIRGGEWNENSITGYCPACGQWHTARRKPDDHPHHYQPCSCGKRIRWKLMIAPRAIPGITGGAMHRWGRALQEGGLI